jgi:dCMP deaminase
VDEAVRPTFEEWASKLAKDISTRGECTRRKVGALIVTQDYRLVAAGYNGAPKGRPSCLDGACPRGQHYELMGTVVHNTRDSSEIGKTRGMGECGGCGGRWPCGGSVDPGSSYDTGKGSCIAVHAEVNAIGDAATRGCSIDGCRMFVSEPPCDGCVKVVQSTGLASLHAPGMDLVLR